MSAQPAWGDLSRLPLEVARHNVGPDRMFDGRPCSLAVVEYVRLAADRPTFPTFDLFPRLSRLAAKWSRRRAT